MHLFLSILSAHILIATRSWFYPVPPFAAERSDIVERRYCGYVLHCLCQLCAVRHRQRHKSLRCSLVTGYALVHHDYLCTFQLQGFRVEYELKRLFSFITLIKSYRITEPRNGHSREALLRLLTAPSWAGKGVSFCMTVSIIDQSAFCH